MPGEGVRFAPFTPLELEALRPGAQSRRPEILGARLALIDEIDAEYERRATALKAYADEIREGR